MFLFIAGTATNNMATFCGEGSCEVDNGKTSPPLLMTDLDEKIPKALAHAERR